MTLELNDMLIVGGYVFLILAITIGLLIKIGKLSPENYFLAGRGLPWWAVGGSLIASNISAEHFIGMSGASYLTGIAIASYEWMGAIALLIVAKFLWPFFLDRGFYSMPQFIGQRFNRTVRGILAVMFIVFFIFINMAAMLYLGGFALEMMLGIPMFYGVIGLALYAVTFSVLGGLIVVVWTDLVQASFFMIGGLVVAYLSLNAVGGGEGIIAGLQAIADRAPERLDLILEPSHEAFNYLPGLSVIFGGMWIANLYNFGCNQYIMQRALAAQDILEAQKGAIFAAYLKFLVPFIVVLPGLAVYVLNADINNLNETYPWLINSFLDSGWRGFAAAALMAAIGSSLSSLVNSTTSIFTIDIYHPFFNPTEDEEHVVRVGKTFGVISLAAAAAFAPMMIRFENVLQIESVFEFILETTGYFSPGVVVIFLFGIFWKRATSKAALWVILLNIPISLVVGNVLFPEMPLLDRIGLSFVALSMLMILISMLTSKGDDSKAEELEDGMYNTSVFFNLSTIFIICLISIFYAVFW